MPKILVVDDAEDIRDVARVALERLGGWEVLTAASGEEAILLAERQPPDAVLLDLSMPDMDGLETLRRLRAHGTALGPPVVLLTAGRGADEPLDVDRLRVAGVVRKPFDPLLLASQVAALLDAAG